MRYCKVNGGTKLESGEKLEAKLKQLTIQSNEKVSNQFQFWFRSVCYSTTLSLSFSISTSSLPNVLLHSLVVCFFCAVFRGLIKFMSSAESRVRCMNSSISAVENLSLYLYGHLSSLWRRSFRAVWTFGFCRDRLCSFCSFYLYFNIHYICISKSTKTACITLSAHHGAFERVFTNARVNRDSVNQYKKRRKKNSVHISSRECVYMGFVCSFE